MALSFSVISLISAFISIFAIFLVFSIINKVYQEEYRRPWLFIGISALFLALSELLRFFDSIYNLKIISEQFTDVLIYLLVFFSITVLSYGLLLEYLILKFYKGKFVKMKFIPVQEGALGGELDINVSSGSSYIAIKKEKDFMYDQFAKATGKGFEGFLITEDNPKDIRLKYKIQKSPIGWISEYDSGINSDFIRKSLDENSDIVSPLQINNMISFVDNFLEQSANPFIMIDMNMILRMNSFYIVSEFIRYISSRVQRYNGILIVMINEDVVERSNMNDLKNFLVELE